MSRICSSSSRAIYLDEDPILARAFVRSYLRPRPPRPGVAARFPVYMLVDRLIVWTWAQRCNVSWWDKIWTLREWAGGYCESLASLG